MYSMKTAFGALLVVIAACSSSNAAPGDDPRLARLMDDRRAIWEAWFANDRPRLEQLLPNSVVAIGADTTWQDRSAVLAAAQAFAQRGGKLLSLNFPKTEKQVFGDVAILYSTYVAEVERAGKTSEIHGRSSEIFVWKNGVWQNAGWHLDAGC